MKRQKVVHDSIVIIRKVNGQRIHDVFALKDTNMLTDDNPGHPINIYEKADHINKVRLENYVAIYPNPFPNDTDKELELDDDVYLNSFAVTLPSEGTSVFAISDGTTSKPITLDFAGTHNTIQAIVNELNAQFEGGTPSNIEAVYIAANNTFRLQTTEPGAQIIITNTSDEPVESIGLAEGTFKSSISTQVGTRSARTIIITRQVGGDRGQGVYEIPQLPVGVYEYEVLTPGRAIVNGTFEVTEADIKAAEKEGHDLTLFKNNVTDPQKGYLTLPPISVPKALDREIRLLDEHGVPIQNHVDVEVENIKYHTYWGNAIYKSHADFDRDYELLTYSTPTWDKDKESETANSYVTGDIVKWKSFYSDGKWIRYEATDNIPKADNYNHIPGESTKWQRVYDVAYDENVSNGEYHMSFLPEKEVAVIRVIPVTKYGKRYFQPFTHSFDNMEENHEVMPILEYTINPPFNVFFKILAGKEAMVEGFVQVEQNESVINTVFPEDGMFKLFGTFDQEVNLAYYDDAGNKVQSFPSILLNYIDADGASEAGMKTQIIELELAVAENEREKISITDIKSPVGSDINTTHSSIVVTGEGFTKNMTAAFRFSNINSKADVMYLSDTKVMVSLKLSSSFGLSGKWRLILNDKGSSARATFRVYPANSGSIHIGEPIQSNPIVNPAPPED